VKAALLTTTGLLLSTAVLATGCGGSDTMRVTLTDNGCAYKGDTTPAPGPFNIEVENTTSHFANFTLSALPAGKNVEDVQHAVEQARSAIDQGKEPQPAIELSGVGGASTRPHETSVIPVNEPTWPVLTRGRFVISCWVHTSAAGLRSDNLPPPAAIYVVPVELEVR